MKVRSLIQTLRFVIFSFRRTLDSKSDNFRFQLFACSILNILIVYLDVIDLVVASF